MSKEKLPSRIDKIESIRINSGLEGRLLDVIQYLMDRHDEIPEELRPGAYVTCDSGYGDSDGDEWFIEYTRPETDEEYKVRCAKQIQDLETQRESDRDAIIRLAARSGIKVTLGD